MSDVAPPRSTLAPASWLATRLARVALRCSQIPGRRQLSHWLRHKKHRSIVQDFTVDTADGARIEALHLHAVAGRRTSPPIVMVHGWLELKEAHMEAAERLTRLGHDVILFDHRGHGGSTGPCTSFGVRERHDLKAVLDAAAERGVVKDRVISLGFSLGAATVLQHAPIDPRVAGVVAIAPFVNLREAIDSFRHRLTPWIDRDWLAAGFERAAGEAGFALDEACTRTAWQQLTVPVLLIEGGADRILPPAKHIHRLLETQTRAPVHHLAIPKANHLTLCRRRWPDMERQIVTFCRRTVDADAADQVNADARATEPGRAVPTA